MGQNVMAMMGGVFLVVYTGFLLTAGPMLLNKEKEEAPSKMAEELGAVRGKLGENEKLVGGLMRKLEQVTDDYRKAIEATEQQNTELEASIARFRTQLSNEEAKNSAEHKRITAALAASPTPTPTAAATQKALGTNAPVTKPAMKAAPAVRQPPTAAPLRADCRPVLEDPDAKLLDATLTLSDSRNKRPVDTLDLKLGRADLAVKIEQMVKKIALSTCIAFNASVESHDPYIEAHNLRYNRKKAACSAHLQQALNEAFGNASLPSTDKIIGMGSAMTVALRPRKEFLTQKQFTTKLVVPQTCFTHGHQLSAEDGDMLGMKNSAVFELTVPAPEAPVAALSGDVLEQLHDGILLDGGRAGKLVMSHELRWNYAAQDFDAKLQAMLKHVFGPVDAGFPDAIVPGWDPSTVDFVLGPRHTARNHHHATVKYFQPIQPDLILTPEGQPYDKPVPIPEPIRIADVITPHAIMTVHEFPHQRPGLPNVVEKELFMSGGVKFNISLHAGVFWVPKKDAVVEKMREEFAAVFGAADTPDEITVVDDTLVDVVLGRRSAPGAWAKHSPFANASHAPPETHRVLRFTIPKEVLLTPPYNSSDSCLLPQASGCEYLAYEDHPVAPYPSLTVALAQRMVFKWAVVGAGPSGMNGMGRVMDLWKGREDQVLWIDERGFQVGRLEGYHDVQSMNPCSDFVSYMKDYKVYSDPAIGSSQSPLLNFEGSARNCRLGYLSEPLLKATRHFRSKLVSYHGRVSDLHKVWFPNANKTNASSTDFVWSLEAAGDERPFWVTDGVVVAIGADHKNNTFAVESLPTEIPFTTGLNPGKLRTFINADTAAKQLRPDGKRVAVFGAGPSGVVALHNLALMPEVASVVHFTHGPRGDYTEMRTAKHNGEYLNITRVKYVANTLQADLVGVDYILQCAGWVWPGFPYNGTVQIPTGRPDSYVGPKLFNVGVKSGSKGNYHQSRSQLFFISSLRTQTRLAAMQCSATNATCMAHEFPHYPDGLTDPYVKPAKPVYAT